MLLMRLIRATGFKRFAAFVSPAFFDVVPTGAMLQRARRLLSDYRDAQGFAEAVEARRRSLDAASIGVALTTVRAAEPGPTRPLADLATADRRSVGEAVLRLYFHQLMTDGPTLLDLSAGRFGRGTPQRGVEWRVRAGYAVWDVRFQSAIRQVYRGFYTDDARAMNDGLEALGLGSAALLFRRHFGDGDQTAVEFSVDHFVSSFHSVFMHCKEHGIRLAPDFLPLGIYLATLYETLEQLGVPLDVRSAFHRAVGADRTPNSIHPSSDPNAWRSTG